MKIPAMVTGVTCSVDKKSYTTEITPNDPNLTASTFRVVTATDPEFELEDEIVIVVEKA